MGDIVRAATNIQPTDPYWVVLSDAISRRAQHIGLHLIPIDIDTRTALQEVQIAVVEELVSQEITALIGCGLPHALTLRLLDIGISVIHLADSTICHPRIVIPRNLYDAGLLIGQYIVERLTAPTTVLMLGGQFEAHQDGLCRIQGFSDAVRNHGHIHVVHVPGPWPYAEACENFRQVFQTLDAPIDVIFGLSDSQALAGRDAARELGLLAPHTLVLGINGDPLALAAIAEGTMTATVDTGISHFGKVVAETAYHAALGHPLEALLPAVPRRLVTSQNVATLAAQKLIAIADLPSRLVGVNRVREQQRLTQLETTVAINRRIGAILDRQQLLSEIADLIRANYGYDLVQLYLWSNTDQTLVLEDIGSSVVSRRVVSLADSGVLGQSLLDGEAIFIPDIWRSQRFPPDADWPATRARVVLPIRQGDTVVGLLDLHSQRVTQHSRAELDGLQLLADQFGIAMQNADLYGDAVTARAVAEKADQLKTRLLANVSHELRTPLNIILGYGQSALGRLDAQTISPAQIATDLRHIYQSGEHLLRLINDLLDLSRAEIDELDLFFETIDPVPMLRDAFAKIIAGSTRPAVIWRLDIPERLPLIQADTVRLHQVLLNVLSNAEKFTKQGEIVLGAAVEPPYLHLWVTDTGCGIPLAQQEQIFEPFVTGEQLGRRPDGVGLGLNIARRLILLHHGSITLESQPDHGSTFHMYLPLPSLEAQTAVLLEQAVVLVVAALGPPPDAVVELCQRRKLAMRHLRNHADLDLALAAGSPAMIAWDAAAAANIDWSLITRIRSYPQLCQAPWLVYGSGDQSLVAGSALTQVLTKPLSSATLGATIMSLQPATTSTVLIVDDDPQARELYRTIVAGSMAGRAIHVADGGVAALDFLERHVPDMVLLDLSMPDVDGFAVLDRLRADPRTQLVPVVIVSGKLMTSSDIKRLEQAHVRFQTKGMLDGDEMAVLLRHAVASEGALAPATSTLVRQAVAFLQHHYAEHISRQSVADAVGVSESYLSQIFNQELGISPWEYLNRYRVLQARQLLRHTTASIAVVGSEVGFDDPSYFGRVFRKHVGQTPREYREQLAPTEPYNRPN